jgi:hypothetical protein
MMVWLLKFQDTFVQQTCSTREDAQTTWQLDRRLLHVFQSNRVLKPERMVGRSSHFQATLPISDLNKWNQWNVNHSYQSTRFGTLQNVGMLAKLFSSSPSTLADLEAQLRWPDCCWMLRKEDAKYPCLKPMALLILLFLSEQSKSRVLPCCRKL